MNTLRRGLYAVARGLLGLVPSPVLARVSRLDERFLDDPATADLFARWSSRERVMADGRFTGWNHQFAAASGLVVDFDKAHGLRGGEAIESVLGQTESAEYYRLERGFLRLPAPLAYRLPFHLRDWMRSFSTGVPAEVDEAHEGVHLALTRYEYANLYHVLIDLYNTFLVLRFLDIDPRTVTLLLADGHPASVLDAFYAACFRECRRIGEYTGTHRFERFVFGIPNRATVLHRNQKGRNTHLEAFREHALTAFGAPLRRAGAARKVIFVWRRDYLAHPRNPDGVVERKLANEDELLQATRAAFPDLDVRGLALETLSVAEQVRLVADTDILVGMHGAALAYVFLLPENAGVLELLPSYPLPASRDTFRDISTLRGLHHECWQNEDPALEEPGKRTYVPPAVVIASLRSLMANMEGHAPTRP